MEVKPEHFQSFFMGGFECATPLIQTRQRIDLLRTTRHDELCADDYAMIRDLGITTVREGLSWSHIDKPEGYSFDRYEQMMRIAADIGIQQIWDLNHFDYPDYIDPLSDAFPKRFAEYAKRCIEVIRKYQKEIIYIVPINEISFFTYIGAVVGSWAPFRKGTGDDFKNQLVRAAIAAMDAIWQEDKNVRFIQVDPVLYRIPKDANNTKQQEVAQAFEDVAFKAWDMLSGRVYPELGGDPKYLHCIGTNYYGVNQEWIVGEDLYDPKTYKTMPWDDPDRVSFVTLLQKVYDRYKCPLIVTETGADKEHRVDFWKRMLGEIDDAIANGLPIYGVCAYPLIDRPDWDQGDLTHAGLWDFVSNDPAYRRIPHEKTIALIKEYIQKHR